MLTVTIRGSSGRLECRFQENKESEAPIALVMASNLVDQSLEEKRMIHMVCQTFVRMGIKVITYTYLQDENKPLTLTAEEELSDAGACLDWFQKRNTYASHTWVVGFSGNHQQAGGVLTAMQLLMRRPEINRFIAISTPANSRDFSFLAPCPVPGLFIHGDRDEFVPKEFIYNLVKTLSYQRNMPMTLKIIRGADHFFSNNLLEVHQCIKDYVVAFHKEMGGKILFPKEAQTSQENITTKMAV